MRQFLESEKRPRHGKPSLSLTCCYQQRRCWLRSDCLTFYSSVSTRIITGLDLTGGNLQVLSTLLAIAEIGGVGSVMNQNDLCLRPAG